MDQRVHELIAKLRSGEAGSEIMERILSLHSELGDDESRTALISIFTATARTYERQAQTDPALIKLINTRKAGVRLMCTQESLLADATIDHKKLKQVVQREVASGNLEPDDELCALAEIGVEFISPMKAASRTRVGFLRRLFG